MSQKEFKIWKETWGLNLISSPKEDKLKNVLNPDMDFSLMTIEEVGGALDVLSNYHLALAAEMGRNFAAVNWNGNKNSRAKLNMIKPIHDSIDLRITVLKKIFDKKIREDMRRKDA